MADFFGKNKQTNLYCNSRPKNTIRKIKSSIDGLTNYWALMNTQLTDCNIYQYKSPK